MKYATVRNSIEDGDLILVRGRSARSWFIRLWTNSRFSHCGIAVWLERENVSRLFLLEAAQDRGVQLIPLSAVLRRDRELDWFALFDQLESFGDDRPQLIHRDAVVAYALDQVGQRYASAWQFVRTFSCVARRVLDWLGFHPDTDATRFFCSEYVVAALEAGGYRPSRSLDPAEMSPGDVAEMSCFQRKGRIAL